MRKVIPLATIEDASQETSNSSNSNEGNGTREQKIRNEQKENKRHDDFKKVICNEVNNNSSYSQFAGFYGFGGVVLGTVIGSIIVLIPTHDVIKNPDYFYEGVLTEVFFTLYMGTYYVFHASYFLNVDCIRHFRTCVKVSIGLVVYRLCGRTKV